MNIKYIEDLVNPMLNSKKELTYDEFEEIFKFVVERKKQYEILDILEKDLNINLVDEKSVNDKYHEEKKSEDKTIIVKKQNSTDIKRKKQKKSSNSRAKYTNEELITLYKSSNNSYYFALLLSKNTGFLNDYINKISKKYNHDLDEEDLFQVASMGFIEGCKRFDTSKGNKLTTYTGFWIRQAIDRYIQKEGFLVRIPHNKFEAIRKVHKLMSDNEGLTLDEIIKNQNLSKEDAKKMKKKYEKLLEFEHQYFSRQYLDVFVGNSENMTILDTLSNDCKEFNTTFSEYSLEQAEGETEIRIENIQFDMTKMLKILSPKERDVLILRYGLDLTGQKKTLEEVGEYFGVTRERIRQIENRAISKLKKLANQKNISSDLKNYLKG